MARKRAKRGEGSVYRQGDGWRAVTRGVVINGEKRTVTGYGDTYAKAVERRMANLEKLKQGTPTGTAKTLSDVVKHWVENADVAERTSRITQATIVNHLYPRLPATTKMSDLTPTMMRELARTLSDDLTPATAHETWKALKIVLYHAVRWEWLVANPMQSIRGPQYTPAKREGDARWVGRRIGVYQGFLRWLKENDDDFYYPALFLSLGLRRNELLGLEWADVTGLTGRNPRLTVQNQLKSGPTRIEQGLKGGAPARSFPLPTVYAKPLREWQKRWTTPTPAWAENQIFARQKPNGRFVGMSESTLNTRWTEKITAYINNDGVRDDFQDFYFTPHGVRHLTASFMAREGVPMTVAQDILGHSTAEMTRYYTHSDSDAKRKAIATVGDGLGSMKPRTKPSKPSKANPDVESPPGPTKNAPESP